MSRIEEALRRSRQRPDRHDTAGVAPATERPHKDGNLALDGYPVERPGGVREARRPSTALPVAPSLADDTRADPDIQVRLRDAGAKLVVHEEVSAASIEQYRRLAATLHELQVERGLRTLMVTSALPREGKTLTVANLALTLSESYARRVIAIDADLRRPSLHEIFGVRNDRGLSRYLQDGNGDCPSSRVSPRLTVLPAGSLRIDPMAGLTSERMAGLLHTSAVEYDWVLLDAPPVGVLPDAQVLARLTKAVVFVVAAGATPLAVVQHAIAALGRECIVGTVLNRVDETSIPATSYYRDYDYSAPLTRRPRE